MLLGIRPQRFPERLRRIAYLFANRAHSACTNQHQRELLLIKIEVNARTGGEVRDGQMKRSKHRAARCTFTCCRFFASHAHIINTRRACVRNFVYVVRCLSRPSSAILIGNGLAQKLGRRGSGQPGIISSGNEILTRALAGRCVNINFASILSHLGIILCNMLFVIAFANVYLCGGRV